MKHITLTEPEAKLIVELLYLASDQFSNHGCNDFDLSKSVPELGDRRELMRRYNESNGSPEDFEYDDEHGSEFKDISDAALMSYLADRVKEQTRS